MPHACTISNCYNRYNPNSDDGSGFSFHRLPKKNRALRKRWLDAIGTRKKQFNNIGRRRKGLSVCSRHFTPEDFSNLDSKSLKIEGSGKEKRPYRRLKDNAVPSIFPDEVFRIPDVRKKRKQHLCRYISINRRVHSTYHDTTTFGGKQGPGPWIGFIGCSCTIVLGVLLL
ncbi:hypothetical protein CAPTEDRAFT_213252 [Capitella teleta]|uniref:THAP-type domain-containing protein n=1 Tax=Capitella teleta TaxID=283909 RepID=R7UWN5_CAPTE|nr:hypothetical protein CAPTEDRAFT_213252 [Capitella teleta]|eukprot:ELU08352.1 hypothetical protein CAPTEDRAFT_213252 [Capitella teleta]